jgi:hypothetical protein
MFLTFQARLIGIQYIKMVFQSVMTLKIRLAFTLEHRLLYSKQKNLGVANTLTNGDNQFARSKNNSERIT